MDGNAGSILSYWVFQFVLDETNREVESDT